MKARLSAEALPENIIKCMRPKDREACGVKTVEERATSAEDKDEKSIQKTVEAYLIQRGYERRTPEDIERGKPARGWFVHLNPLRSKGNPIILDLLVLANSTPREYLELELKTTVGAIYPHQQALINQGASLARSAIDAMAIIKHWDNSLHFC